MPFKDSKQRAFLFAMDKDKQKQGLPQQSSPNQSPSGIAPPPMGSLKPQHIGMTQVPKLTPPNNPINPTAVPALPQMGKLPKFGKMRNSLKGGPFKK